MVQDKPKFKLSRQEMLEFNDACDEAASCCPQYRNDWGFEDRDILQGAIKPKQLVRHWLDSSVLFSSGYHRELSPDAQAVFKRYKLYKAARTIWKAQQEALGVTS